jgi:hypothetical protein
VNTPPNETSPSSGAGLATVALACLVYSALALVSLHLLRPDYAPASNFISNYAVGRHGWIMTTWFLAQSACQLLLAVALARTGLRSAPARIAQFLMVVVSIGLVVSAIFPTDVPGAPLTRHGDIHEMSFLVNVSGIILSAILLSVSFGSHPRWRPFRPLSWCLTGLILLAFVIQFLTLHKGMPYGLVNRFFVLVAFAFGLAIALRTRAISRGVSL